MPKMMVEGMISFYAVSKGGGAENILDLQLIAGP